MSESLEPPEMVLPDGCSVRLASSSDLDAIYAVESRGQQAPWSIGVISKELEVDWSTIWVVLREESVVAYLCFWIVADEVHILNVVVDPSARRQGIAATLVRGLIECATGRELTLVTLEVRVGNDAAIALYSAHGFQEIGRRHGYYSDNGEDAVVMARILEEDSSVG